MKNNVNILIGLLILSVAFLSSQSDVFTGRAIQSCVDSDKGNFEVKGTVNADGEKLEDYCEENTLVEYLCNKNNLEVKVYACPSLCVDGACVVSSGQPPGVSSSLSLGSVRDQIEIGEYFGDVRETLSEFDTPALKGGLIYTQSGATEFNQYLRFKTNDGVLDGRVLFAENEDDAIDDYLVFLESNEMFEFELQFENGLKSDISGSSLPDLEGESLFILDREYAIANAELSGNRVTLELVSGDLPSTISEGETKTYTLQNGELVIEVLNIDDSSRRVTLSVNGEIEKLEEGEIAIVKNAIIGIRDVLISEAFEGDDFVVLYVGAERIEFEDSDYTDDSFDQSIKVNGDSISSGFTKIKGTKSGSEFEIFSLKYRMKPDPIKGNTVYVPEGKGLKEFLRDPEALLANWDIVYKGLSSQSDITLVKIDPSGSNQYDLEFENTKGDRYDLPLVSNNGGNLELGDDANRLHFIEGSSSTDFIILRNDYLVVSSRNDKNGITNIIRYSNIDTSSKTLDFDELVEGSKKVIYSGTEGSGASGNLIVGGHTYKVYVGASPDYKLAMDLNRDGDVASDEVNIVINGGGLFDLGSSITPNTDFDITLTTDKSLFDSSSSDEVITINVLASGNDVDLNIPSQTGVTIETDSGKNLALSNYGVFMKQEKDDPDELTLHYPKSQAVADIDLIFFQTPTAAVEVKPAPLPPVEESLHIPPPQPKVTPPPIQQVPAPKVKIVQKDSWFMSLWKSVMKSIFG